jgi:large subunit ribosomal protein L17
MLRNMATSLVLHERIQTTLPKAKELRSVFDRMITLGKRGDLHSRRMALAYLFDDSAVTKVFSDLATRFKTRPGGYTRILKQGPRFGDGADMALIELVDYGDQKAKASGGKAASKTAKSSKEGDAAKAAPKAKAKAKA